LPPSPNGETSNPNIAAPARSPNVLASSGETPNPSNISLPIIVVERIGSSPNTNFSILGPIDPNFSSGKTSPLPGTISRVPGSSGFPLVTAPVGLPLSSLTILVAPVLSITSMKAAAPSLGKNLINSATAPFPT